MIAVVWLALGMSVPVSAWTAHEVAHGAAQVSIDAHHHHEADGGISIHEHDDGRAPDGGAPDGGHDHMPSVLLTMAMLPAAELALSAPGAAGPLFMQAAVPSPPGHASGGLRRPPRLG